MVAHWSKNGTAGARSWRDAVSPAVDGGRTSIRTAGEVGGGVEGLSRSRSGGERATAEGELGYEDR